MAIDLKSFYASVECQERNLDPLTTNLVVADESRTEKTICLAVSPTLKKYGIGGRARLFEVIQRVREVNEERRKRAPNHQLTGESYDDLALKKDPSLALSYVVAKPRMAFYIDYSARIYEIYLKYISPEDIHVYSIDEVFIDATNYLNTYHVKPRELAQMIIHDIYKTTGITATCGIGTNLYLCKVAMDIVAKKLKPNQYGVRIAQLDEERYKKYLWDHEPITDFWRVGNGYARRLQQAGLYTMGDIARCSLGKKEDKYNEDLLFDLFGINAELLIDHAWGKEPCTMKDIKAYKPSANSLGSGQVLSKPYTFDKARLILKEMLDSLTLDLFEKGLVTDSLVLTIGYDKENLENDAYYGEVKEDFYGRKIPKHAHGTVRIKDATNSNMLITKVVLELYDRIVDRSMTIRRINITAIHVVSEMEAKKKTKVEQLDLFTDYQKLEEERKKEEKELEREKKLQEATLKIKKKYGKNALLKGMDLEEGANAKERNTSIGGHKA